jgi:transposase InsO family protein
LCHGLPRSTIGRWKQRLRGGRPLLQSPGPKKLLSPDWPALIAQIKALTHGRRRTQGTTGLHQEHRREISRRRFQQLVQEERHRLSLNMKRIQWLLPGTVWSVDATHYRGRVLVPLQDLASRYRFTPLLGTCEDGGQIATFLDAAFHHYGPPLLLKRDNGGPFNCHEVNAVLAEHKVLPLNSPPFYPPYNGAMERSIRDWKRHLSKRLLCPAPDPVMAAVVETIAHELNHQPRRCLKGKSACQIHHDPALRLPIDPRSRDHILNLLMSHFCRNLQIMPARTQHAVSAVWRLTVTSWLRCQGLISFGKSQNQTENVSTIFPKKWSHN